MILQYPLRDIALSWFGRAAFLFCVRALWRVFTPDFWPLSVPTHLLPSNIVSAHLLAVAWVSEKRIIGMEVLPLMVRRDENGVAYAIFDIGPSGADWHETVEETVCYRYGRHVAILGFAVLDAKTREAIRVE